MKNLQEAQKLLAENKFYVRWSDSGNDHSDYYDHLNAAKKDYYFANFESFCKDRDAEVDIRTLPEGIDNKRFIDIAKDFDSFDEMKSAFDDYFWENSISIIHKSEVWENGKLKILEGVAPYSTKLELSN